jgi:signal transduction histidine kinase
MLNISWRQKLFLFAILFALLPIAISSLNMITITQDELKSNRNNELIFTTGQLAEDINRLYNNNWLSPLLLIKSGVESEILGANEKATFLSAGIDHIEDIVALTLYFEVQPGEYAKAVQTYKKSFKTSLEKSGLEASAILDVSPAEIDELKKRGHHLGAPAYIPKLDTWLMTMIEPVEIAGAPAATLAARISLDNVREHIQKHPFNKNGRIFLVDKEGKEVFSLERKDWSALKVVQDATALLTTNSRAQAVTNYQTANGEKMLGAYDFPQNLQWAVIAEIAEAKAYLAVAKMRRTLMYWLLFGLALAIFGVAIFSRQISRPIIKISEAADQIASGNFDVQVKYPAKDEIGVLAQSLLHMSGSLKENFAQIAAQKNELEEYSKTLEEKVEARTLELKEKNTALENTLSQLKQTQNQLVMQEKLASLGALTAGIAHEIKNPLNFVNNFAALTIDLAEELNAEVLPHLEKFNAKSLVNVKDILGNIQLNAAKIAEHGKRADGIIKSMLEHSRGDAGDMQLTDLNKMLEDFVNLAYHGMRAQDSAFNVKMEKHLDPDLRAVKINPQALSRVIINLCNNGFYATREKQKKNGADYSPTLTFSTADTGEKIEIRLRDNGTGIPASIRDKIFNPFFSTKPTGTGTGLGLSISYDIITQMHKGELQVQTEEGQYTEFIIRLPKNLQ